MLCIVYRSRQYAGGVPIILVISLFLCTAVQLVQHPVQLVQLYLLGIGTADVGSYDVANQPVEYVGTFTGTLDLM